MAFPPLAGVGLGARPRRGKTGLPPQNTHPTAWGRSRSPSPDPGNPHLRLRAFDAQGQVDLGLALARSWPPSPFFFGGGPLWRPHLCCFQCLPSGFLHLLGLLKQAVVLKIYLNLSFVLKKSLCAAFSTGWFPSAFYPFSTRWWFVHKCQYWNVAEKKSSYGAKLF